jgi:hypothetical protein
MWQLKVVLTIERPKENKIKMAKHGLQNTTRDTLLTRKDVTPLLVTI